MKRLVIMALILMIPLVVRAAKWGFELTPFIGFDAKAYAGERQGNDVLCSVRLRHARSLVGLELYSTLAHGYGAAVTVDAVRVWRLRFTLDAGVFWPVYETMSVPDVPRSFDITFGAGLEVRLYRQLVAIFNWRAYFPDPRLVGYYGDFSFPIYKRALKEAPWWLGLGWRF